MPRPGTGGRLAGDGRIDVSDAHRLAAYLAGVLPYNRLAPEAIVTTFAGSGKPEQGGGDYADGPVGSARFRTPWTVDVDRRGVIYVADTFNHCVRKIVDGIVTTLAGVASARRSRGGWVDGPADRCEFYWPKDVAADEQGTVYVVDENHTVRVIAPDGSTTTLAGGGRPGYRDGVGRDALFNEPSGIARLPNGDLLVADTGNDCLRLVTLDGRVSTWAGDPKRPGFEDGPGVEARFDQPWGVAVDRRGFAYVADGRNNAIRRISPAGFVFTLAGDGDPGVEDGLGRAARFTVPMSVDVDGEGNIYTSDWTQHTIRRISAKGEVSTLAGIRGLGALRDGPGSEAAFTSPMGLAVGPDGDLYVADTDNQRIRKIRQR